MFKIIVLKGLLQIDFIPDRDHFSAIEFSKEIFIDPLEDRFALLAAPDTIDFPLLVGLLMLSCVAVSALGSGITLRRFLRV